MKGHGFMAGFTGQELPLVSSARNASLTKISNYSDAFQAPVISRRAGVIVMSRVRPVGKVGTSYVNDGS
jgi:hypothetical protein